MKKSAFLFSLAAAGLTASAAYADAEHPLADLMKNTGLEFTGYARMGTGLNDHGARQDIYTLPNGIGGGQNTGRFGNEIGYAEFGLGGVFFKGSDGSEFDAHMMEAWCGLNDPGFQSQDGGCGGTTAGIFNEQVWAEAKGLVQGNSVSFWAGKRFYRMDGPPGSDINMLDYRPFGPGLTGAGFDKMDVGIGKLWLVYAHNGNVNNGPDTTSSTVDLSLGSVPVNKGGKLYVTGQFTLGGSDNLGAAATHPNHSGAAGYIWHAQDLGDWGGNTLSVAYGNGSAANGGLSGLSAQGGVSGESQFRVYDNVWANINPSWSGQAVAIYESKDSKTGVPGSKRDMIRLGVHPQFHISQHVGFDMEAVYATTHLNNMSDENMTKISLGPTLRPGRGYWDRPEIRLFVTHAWWNDAARKAGAMVFDNHGVVTNDTSGTSVGVQTEFWW